MTEPQAVYAIAERRNEQLRLTDGEVQLIKQMRDISERCNGSPFQVTFLIVGDTWHIYESVHRGKGKRLD